MGVSNIGIRLRIKTIDGYDGTDALKSRWVTSYIYTQPLDRGETDAEQVRDTHQTGAWAMMFNKYMEA